MTYQHIDINGQLIDLTASKAVCIGANYLDHIKEMSSITNEEAVFFIKPSTSLVPLEPGFSIPTQYGECHHELEVAVLIKDKLSNVKAEEAKSAIWGFAISLDLTLREKQKQLKQLGRPWERAKGFDGACPVSGFIPYSQIENIDSANFSLEVNDQIVQSSDASFMIRNIYQVIAQASEQFTLLPGDIVLTGTPAGVGALHPGDQLALKFNQHQFKTEVTE
ncbi:fumarylacetoacetate hydrolase family protein [Catenovulum maritimum]|uniref:Fumarylacetoacetase-like C-terminal domain-containing protein n=1 Tax=Catenovulum maritimum TaxID=1513271 RepID=A0A0J8GZ52_9ALTE|nr:fumarylacetoacetate hydrolase family protein [Catenovulum maritimum]KMT66504.1 hypothetical protein XM47_02915 [Catenovulum maritimum]